MTNDEHEPTIDSEPVELTDTEALAESEFAQDAAEESEALLDERVPPHAHEETPPQDVGAEVGECAGGDRTRDHASEVEHPDAVKRQVRIDRAGRSRWCSGGAPDVDERGAPQRRIRCRFLHPYGDAETAPLRHVGDGAFGGPPLERSRDIIPCGIRRHTQSVQQGLTVVGVVRVCADEPVARAEERGERCESDLRAAVPSQPSLTGVGDRQANGIDGGGFVEPGEARGRRRGAHHGTRCQRRDVGAGRKRHHRAHNATLRCAWHTQANPATRPGWRADLPDTWEPRNLLLVRPTGKSEEPEGLAPSSGEPLHPEPLIERTRPFGLGWDPHSSKPVEDGCRSDSSGATDLTGHEMGSKIEKLPFCLVVRLGGGSVRSLRTQQRALVKCQITSCRFCRWRFLWIKVQPLFGVGIRIVSNDGSTLVSSNSLRRRFPDGVCIFSLRRV